MGGSIRGGTEKTQQETEKKRNAVLQGLLQIALKQSGSGEGSVSPLRRYKQKRLKRRPNN